MSRNRLIIVSGHLGLPYKPGARNWANCSGISQVWLFWRNCAHQGLRHHGHTVRGQRRRSLWVWGSEWTGLAGVPKL